MTLAIMQPYFFPYWGYFQLLNKVDKFVVYDDVNFIKKGWINRNRVLINGEPTLISIPVQKVSQNRTIRETKLADQPKWKTKLLRTLEQSYKKAPYFQVVFPQVEALLLAEYPSIADLNLATIKMVHQYLKFDTELVESSVIYGNQHLAGQERILDICKQEQATVYINPIGGMELYNSEYFEQAGVQLFFIHPHATPYQQFGTTFHPNLSVLDSLFFLSPEQLKTKLSDHQLVTCEEYSNS